MYELEIQIVYIYYIYPILDSMQLHLWTIVTFSHSELFCPLKIENKKRDLAYGKL